MSISQSFTVVALGCTIGKLGWSYGKYWWNKRSLKDAYVEMATASQIAYELDASELDFEDVEFEGNDDKRRISSKHHGSYRVHLVQRGKAKFGTPTRCEANRLVVRKFLYDTCREDGLVARHINEHIDIATALVFVPSRRELEAAAINHTALSKLRTGVHRDLGGGVPTIA